MGEAAKVYAEELQKLAYGHPLWWPEHTKGPGGRERGIEIGDVGYIDTDGAFHPLFNIAHEREHELNAGKTPPNFAPLVWEDDPIETKTSFLQPGPQSNSSIKHHQTRAEIAGNEPISGSGMEISYRFECSDKQGAILMLWDDATKTDLRLQQKHLMKYMKAHHESWYQFATETRGVDCEREDIVVVRGFVKTSCWTVAALTDESAHTREVTLNGQLGPLFNIGAGYAAHQGRLSSIHQRSGPSMRMSSSITRTHWQTLSPVCTNKREIHPALSAYETMPRDQCVFLNYYKIKRKFLFLEQIVARAGASELPDPDGSRDKGALLTRRSPSVGDVDIQAESVVAKPLNPLDVILDYILEYSEARVAIASYTDLENFKLDTQWPTTFPEMLRSFSPNIFVDDWVGTLSISCARVVPILPQEILSLIAMCLVGDIAALKSCSLVCRLWHASCGPHLFRVLQPLRGSSDPQQCLQAFTEFLTSSESPPNFLQWVHKLCLVGSRGSNSPVVVSVAILSSIVAKLSRIHDLELEGVNIANYPLDTAESGALSLGHTKLDVLSMKYVHLGEPFPSQLLSVLGLFSCLRVLHIRNPDILGSLSPPKEFLPNLPNHLHTEGLVLEADPPTKDNKTSLTTDQILNVLFESHPLCSLQRIEIRCHTMDEVEAVGRLIRKAHATLQDVRIDISGVVRASDDYEYISDTLSLHECDSLHRLCINVFPDPTGSPVPSQWKRASELLIEVISTAPRSITSMTIPLRSHNVPDRDIVCWEALDRLEKCSGWERFGNLSELKIAFTPNCCCLQLNEHYVSSKLPDLVGRGLLKFIGTGVFAGQPDENLPVQSYDGDDRLPFHAWERHETAERHTLMSYANQHLTTRNGRIQIIPQGVYPAPQPYTPLPNIRFTVRGSLGMRLVDAINPAFHGLCDAGVVPRMTECAKKFTLRLRWPGYPAWSEVIHAYDHTYDVNPSTLRKVAQLAAQKIQIFCNELRDQAYDMSSGGDGWQLQHFPIERLVLLELRQVSHGGWQPVIGYL